MTQEEIENILNSFVATQNLINTLTERVQVLSDNQDSYSMALGAIINILESNNLIEFKEEEPKQ